MPTQTSITAILVLIFTTSIAEASSADLPDFKIFGDSRLRFESDFDSMDENGQKRDDRDRIRLRARVGVRVQFNDDWLLQARARTGPKYSQQSTNITVLDLSGNENDKISFVMDQWFIQNRQAHTETWLGRNTFPFWRHNNNEMFWNDNATIAGIYHRRDLLRDTSTSLELRTGYFALPDGAIHFSGQLAAGQLVGTKQIGEAWKLTASGGYYHIDGSGSTKHLVDGNGDRDYQIAIATLQAERALQLNNIDINFVRLGADLIRNFADYSSQDADAVTAEFSKAKDGFTVSSVLGSTITNTNGRGRWQLSYMYAYIEKLAINSAYGQSNWVRWGANRQSDVSNLKGHELGFRYWLSHNMDINNRLFVVDAISSPQDGNRFRVDLNIRF